MTRVRKSRARSQPSPGSAARRLRETISGLELFLRMSRGEVPPPPLVGLLGFRITHAEAGHIVFAADPREDFYNGGGVIHGGWSAALLDSALGCAVNSMMPAGRWFTTLELKLNLTRPLTHEVGEIRCEARVLHLGSRIATAEARILDKGGKLYAHGTTTCILVEQLGAQGAKGSRGAPGSKGAHGARGAKSAPGAKGARRGTGSR